MPAATISIKPTNHRIYQCPQDKKQELLEKIIEKTGNTDIVIACSSNSEVLEAKFQSKNVRVMEDRDLVKDKDLTCDFLISYDMPIEAIVYIARVSKAKNKAVMLLDESEQKALHSIEMLLGRAIKQEIIAGFEYPQKVVSDKPVRKKLSKDEIKEVAKKRYEKSTQEQPKFDKEKSDRVESRKPKRDFKSEGKKDDKWAKKRKAPKTTGKKISIKARKVKED